MTLGIKRVSVVVPVYNSAATLAALVERLTTVLTPLVPEHEILLVDDHSVDDSWERVRDLADRYPALRGMTLSRNYGQHNAVLAGVRAASGDVVVTVDDDLQHPPEEIPLLLNALTEGFDVVYGTPRHERHGWRRDAASRASKWVMRLLLGWRQAPAISDFRAFRTNLREGFAASDGPSVSFDAMLSWVTTSFCAVPVEHAPRRVGRSNYRLGSLLDYGITMATSYSTAPMRLATIAGGIAGIAGAVLLVLTLAVPGWHAHGVIGMPFVAGLVGVLGGAQLVAVGIAGEYLGRLYFRSIGRPQYLVRDQVGVTREWRPARTLDDSGL